MLVNAIVGGALTYGTLSAMDKIKPATDDAETVVANFLETAEKLRELRAQEELTLNEIAVLTTAFDIVRGELAVEVENSDDDDLDNAANAAIVGNLNAQIAILENALALAQADIVQLNASIDAVVVSGSSGYVRLLSSTHSDGYKGIQRDQNGVLVSSEHIADSDFKAYYEMFAYYGKPVSFENAVNVLEQIPNPETSVESLSHPSGKPYLLRPRTEPQDYGGHDLELNPLQMTSLMLFPALRSPRRYSSTSTQVWPKYEDHPAFLIEFEDDANFSALKNDIYFDTFCATRGSSGEPAPILTKQTGMAVAHWIRHNVVVVSIAFTSYLATEEFPALSIGTVKQHGATMGIKSLNLVRSTLGFSQPFINRSLRDSNHGERAQMLQHRPSAT